MQVQLELVKLFLSAYAALNLASAKRRKRLEEFFWWSLTERICELEISGKLVLLVSIDGEKTW